jgi:hypothetical protein
MERATASAAKALAAARAAGIRVRIDGDALALQAAVQAPVEVLDLLARHKAAIVRLLRPGNDRWSAEDWRQFFEGRVEMAEINGGLPRDRAEARAFSCCVGEWLHRNPVRSAPGCCARCGGSRGLLLPYLTGYSVRDPGHTWLHRECSPAWHQDREAQAVAAILAIGIAVRVKVPDGSGKDGGALPAASGKTSRSPSASSVSLVAAVVHDPVPSIPAS